MSRGLVKALLRWAVTALHTASSPNVLYCPKILKLTITLTTTSLWPAIKTMSYYPF